MIRNKQVLNPSAVGANVQVKVNAEQYLKRVGIITGFWDVYLWICGIDKINLSIFNQKLPLFTHQLAGVYLGLCLDQFYSFEIWVWTILALINSM